MQRILYILPISGGLPIFGYGLFLMLGFAAALILACRRGRKAGFPTDAVLDVGLIALVAGLIGARAAFLIFDYSPDEGGVGEWLAIWRGGLTFQGGLLLALIAVYLHLKRKKIPLARMLDVFAPALALGTAFGRIGCLLNGCCWGAVAPPGSWFSMYFPEEAEPMANQYWFYEANPGGWAELLRRLGYPADYTPILPVYATQIISAVGLLLIAGGLIWLERRRPERPEGQVMIWFLFAYGTGRFLIEFWRDDTPLRYGFGAFPGFRLGQWLALAMLAAAWIWRLAPRRRGKPAPGRRRPPSGL
ncbi:MAG: prolipoprotein diacylglyceryl transferase [Planctomycetota bacterium]|jgi:phosphatidylglycerol:prolipoprotein diacylglycerol transferase|nr:prolipoprotein diacylglyceryl transferase [Planctomycetota bacterium]